MIMSKLGRFPGSSFMQILLGSQLRFLNYIQVIFSDSDRNKSLARSRKGYNANIKQKNERQRYLMNLNTNKKTKQAVLNTVSVHAIQFRIQNVCPMN